MFAVPLKWIMDLKNRDCQGLQDTLTHGLMKYLLPKSPGLDLYLERKMQRLLYLPNLYLVFCLFS